MRQTLLAVAVLVAVLTIAAPADGQRLSPKHGTSPTAQLGETGYRPVSSLFAARQGPPRWLLPAVGAGIGAGIGIYTVAGSDRETTAGSMLIPPVVYGAAGALLGFSIDWLIREVRG